MKKSKRVNQIFRWVGIISTLFAFFLAVLNFGMGLDTAMSNIDGSSLSLSSHPYQDMAIRYLIISIFFLLSIVSFQIFNKPWLKLMGFFLLFIVIIQCKVLISLKPNEAAEWITDFESRFRLIWQIDFLLLFMAAVLIVLQIYLIKINRFAYKD
jgi:hypothetical protein